MSVQCGREGGTAPSRCEWLPNSPGGAPPPPTVAIVLGNSAGSRGGGAPTRITSIRVEPGCSTKQTKTFSYQHNAGIGSASLPPRTRGARAGACEKVGRGDKDCGLRRPLHQEAVLTCMKVLYDRYCRAKYR